MFIDELQGYILSSHELVSGQALTCHDRSRLHRQRLIHDAIRPDPSGGERQLQPIAI